MRPDYYNYRLLPEGVIADLYADMEPVSFATVLDFNLMPIGYSIRFALQEAHAFCQDLFEIGDFLDITLELPHWLEHDLPANKFQRGPFTKGAVEHSMTNRLLAQHKLRDTADGLLPVAMEISSTTQQLRLVEVPPDRATHLLIHHRGPLERKIDSSGVSKPPLSSEIAYFDCDSKVGSFTLHEFGRLVQEAYKYTCNVGKETMVRRRLCQDEAAFQRLVWPTCPSVITLRLLGAIEHGVMPPDLLKLLEQDDS